MSIWQTKTWQEMLKKSKQTEKFFEIDWIFIEKRSLWLWEHWLFIIWLDKKIDEKTIEKLINLTKKEKCLFLQIETINYENNFNFLDWTNLEKWFYKKFITPYTAIINLEKNEEEILSWMKPKWRYNIKLAKKKWVEVNIVKKSLENIKKFYNLMIETTSRDWFKWNKLEYYKNFLENIDNSKLILAKKDWEIIAWGIFVFDKKVSIYYYWASTSKKEYRNLMAPYLVQWEAIKYAKSIWSKIYDFLWVASPNEKNSSLTWVTDFKKKFTKNILKVSESYIFINKKIKYLFINTLRKLKK